MVLMAQGDHNGSFVVCETTLYCRLKRFKTRTVAAYVTYRSRFITNDPRITRATHFRSYTSVGPKAESIDQLHQTSFVLYVADNNSANYSNINECSTVSMSVIFCDIYNR